MTWYVMRDAEGSVTSLTSDPAEGHEERLADDHPDVVAYRERLANPVHYQIAPTTFWRRCTGEEAKAFRDLLDSFELSSDGERVRLAMIFKQATVFYAGDSEWPTLQAVVEDAVGAARASELLALEDG